MCIPCIHILKGSIDSAFPSAIVHTATKLLIVRVPCRIRAADHVRWPHCGTSRFHTRCPRVRQVGLQQMSKGFMLDI